MTQEDYTDKLRRHSFESRVDPLRDAVRRAVALWHQEDEQEKNDLSEDFWRAMGDLEVTLRSVMRGGEEEVSEVEVTESAFHAAHEDAGERSPMHAEAPQTPVAARRSGAKNISAPEYQTAFVDEARRSMGQPSMQDAEALVDQAVIIEFNDDTPPVQGLLLSIVAHPTQRTYQLVVKITADPEPPGPMFYALNSVQSISAKALP